MDRENLHSWNDLQQYINGGGRTKTELEDVAKRLSLDAEGTIGELRTRVNNLIDHLPHKDGPILWRPQEIQEGSTTMADEITKADLNAINEDINEALSQLATRFDERFNELKALIQQSRAQSGQVVTTPSAATQAATGQEQTVVQTVTTRPAKSVQDVAHAFKTEARDWSTTSLPNEFKYEGATKRFVKVPEGMQVTTTGGDVLRPGRVRFDLTNGTVVRYT